jgi:hypothetical protein
MPPSTRKYGPVTYSKPPPVMIKSSTSASLHELMVRMDCKSPNLLSESIGLSALSSNHPESPEIVPPFSRGRRPPVVDFTSLHSNLFTSPPDRSSVDTSSALGERVKVITTGPTSPRLKAMLREVVSIKKWRVR